MTERSDTPESPSKEQESLRDKILAERDKGNLVYAHLEGYSVVKVEDFVKQPAEGMLYDLNRGEEVSLSFITEKKWVNDFAVALTIRKLVEQRDAARSERLPLDQIEETAINMACPVGFVTYLRGLKGNAAPQENTALPTTAQVEGSSPSGLRAGGCPNEPAESASSSRYALSYTPPEVFAPPQDPDLPEPLLPDIPLEVPAESAFSSMRDKSIGSGGPMCSGSTKATSAPCVGFTPTDDELHYARDIVAADGFYAGAAVFVAKALLRCFERPLPSVPHKKENDHG